MARVSEIMSQVISNGEANMGLLPGPIQSAFNRREVDVTIFGAVGNGFFDDTAAIKQALSVSNNLFFPAGTYIISDTLKLRSNTTIRGVYKQTNIKFVKDNATLFIGSDRYDPTTAFNFSRIKDLNIVGLGKSYNQTGLNIGGYLSCLEGITVRNFKKGVDLRGVGFDFLDCYFVENGIGVSIQDAISSTGALDFNTLLHFHRCTFTNNDLGMCNVGDGQTYRGGRENIIDLGLLYCIFEANGQGFNLMPFKGHMQECWFENNTTRSTTTKYAWLIDSNYYSTNGGDNTINFIPVAGSGSQFYGVVDLARSYGEVSARYYDFQNYDTSGNDISTKQLAERKVGTLQSAINIDDSTEGSTRIVPELNPMTVQNTTTPIMFNKTTQFSIKPDGTIYFKGNEIKHTGFAVSKLATGKYKITFKSSGFQGIPQAFATSPTSIGGDGDQDMFYCTTRMQATSGHSDYANFGTFNVMYINTYSRPGSGGADVLADAWVHVTINHA